MGAMGDGGILRLYALLMSKNLLNNCSPKDVILHLSRVYKVKIGDDWVLSEVPKKRS